MSSNVILKTVANPFPNIECFGAINLAFNPGEVDYLEQLQNLKIIVVGGNLIDFLEKSDNIFNILASKVTLNKMCMYIDQARGARGDFIYSNVQRKMMHLECLSLRIGWIWTCPNTEMFFYYLFGIIFSVKTLLLWGAMNTINILNTAVRNLNCLENVLVDIIDPNYDDAVAVDKFCKCYEQLLLEKVMANKRMGISKRLIIYVEEKIADKC